MSNHLIHIQSGDEPMIAEAVRYMEGLGVPRADIRSLSVGGEVNGPMTIITEIYVRKPDGAAETEVIERVGDGVQSYERQADDTARIEIDTRLGHDGSDRWTGDDRKDER